MVGIPETRYVWDEDVSIAYQEQGSGPPDLVFVPGMVGQLELNHEIAGYSRFMELLSQFCRVVPFDKRGFGLSDRLAEIATLEDRLDDVTAVATAISAERPSVFGWSEGGVIAGLYAATHPQRIARLVLWDTFHTFRQGVDNAAGVPDTRLDWMRGPMIERWGRGSTVTTFFPDDVEDPEAIELWSRIERNTISPSGMKRSLDWIADIAVPEIWPTITAPALLLNRSGSTWAPAMREIAQMIPGATHVEFPGAGHAPWGLADDGEIVGVIEEFLTGEAPGTHSSQRSLATVVFTDIVDSTTRATELGDHAWKAVLDDHDRIMRQQCHRYRGEMIKYTGDGALVTFDGPGRAIDCALALVERVASLGIQIRVGLHTGEIERRGADVSGLAVNLASRIESAAGPSQVLVSRTVTDLVIGSHHQFTPAGQHELKGIPGTWDLYTATGPR